MNLSFDYIKDNTLWVIKYDSGYRKTVKGSEVSKYHNEDDIDDIDTVWWRGQPEDLQEFWKSYEYANYKMDRRDLFFVDNFYKEWVKDPDQFKARTRPVISTLQKELRKLNPLAKEQVLNVLVTNYDGDTIGNHYYENWVSAMDSISYDFDVINVSQNSNNVHIVIQDDDYDKCECLSVLSNEAAIRNFFN